MIARAWVGWGWEGLVFFMCEGIFFFLLFEMNSLLAMLILLSLVGCHTVTAATV